MQGARRWDSFDGLRAVLVTGVMVHHMEWTLGRNDPVAEAGWLPVDGFFVLSGFLIAHNLLRELDATGTIRSTRFLTRRAARLVPALAVVLVAIGAVSVLVDDRSWSRTWPSLASSASYVHNLNYLYGWLEPLLLEVGPLWSLSVEVQFYVVMPFVVLALWRLGAPRWVWATMFAVIGVASAIGRGVLGFGGFPTSYLFTPVRLDSLMWGVLIAIGWPVLARLPAVAVRGAALAATVVLVWLYVTAGAYEDPTYRWGMTLAGLASAAVVIGLLLLPRSAPSRALSTRPMVALGRRSYSAYLWHQAVFLVLLRHAGLRGWWLVAVGFAATWVLSDLTYRFVERPVLVASSRRAASRRPGQVAPSSPIGTVQT